MSRSLRSSIDRSVPLSGVAVAAAVAAVLSIPASAAAQKAATTDEGKIAEALGAAPPEVAEGATVLDWPAEEGADFRVLREGSNGWTCLPDPPGDANFEPMCNDGTWMQWVKAYASGKEPKVDGLGVSYMLNSKWAVSNTDPSATEATPDNEWHEGGAHVMLVVPEAAMLDGFPDDPGTGGAYVMWKGTPFVHLMIPMPEGIGHRPEGGS